MVVILASLLVFTEMAIRISAKSMPPWMANDLLRPYGTRNGGMYFLDPVTGLNFLYPNDERDVVFNGYRWHHSTDHRGTRNPPDTGSRVLLLGDSFIYGHGVEENQTVAHYLREEHGWEVYNLARQGDGLGRESVMLRTFIDELKPEKVVLFPFINDFNDVVHLPEDLQLDKIDYKALRERLNDPDVRVHEWDFEKRFYTYRFLMILNQRRKFNQRDPAMRPTVQAVTDSDQFAENRRRYTEIFDSMLEVTRSRGAELQVVYLQAPNSDQFWIDSQERFEEFLQKLCAEREVSYLSAQEMLKDPQNSLPGDGHLSPAGHRALAEVVARLDSSSDVHTTSP